MNSLTFITGNLNKVKQTQKYSPVPIEHKKLDLTEIQSLDIKEVVEHKVKEAYRILKKPVLIEDTSLIIHAYGKLPGTFIKFFLQEIGVEGISKLANGTDRKATVMVMYGLYDGTTMQFFDGVLEGSVAQKPGGSNGFGFDSIFIPKGEDKTIAEMTEDEFDKYNKRRIALEKMRKHMNKS